MNPRMMVCAFLVGCSTVALGQYLQREHSNFYAVTPGIESTPWWTPHYYDQNIESLPGLGLNYRTQGLESLPGLEINPVNVDGLKSIEDFIQGGDSGLTSSGSGPGSKRRTWSELGNKPGADLVNESWLRQQNEDLLDIIKILYKDRRPEVEKLEASQANWPLENQIESRIALIKDSLSKKNTK
jgi:hypothetical protein